MFPTNLARHKEGSVADWLLGNTPSNAVDGVALRNRLERRQRRSDVEREVPAAARCDAYVLAKDSCPPVCRHRNKLNGTAPAVPDYRFTMGRFNVLHPIRIRAK